MKTTFKMIVRAIKGIFDRIAEREARRVASFLNGMFRP